MGNTSTTVSLQDHDDRATRKKKTSPGGIENCKKKSSKRTGMIPEADYNECDGGDLGLKGSNKKKGLSNGSAGVQFSEDGLVMPKKPGNPCMESSERQNLHKELLFNQKIGKSVIGQKTELQRAMDKIRDEQKKKELEEEKIQKKSAFEKKLEEQANKLKLQEESESKKLNSSPLDQPEFLRVHARVCAQTVEPTT